MIRGLQGTYRAIATGDESYRLFVPRALPPHPPLELDYDLQERMDRANLSLGRLDGLSTLLPDRQLFLYHSVRKEAVLSSQIEGTQSSLSDLILHESGEIPGLPLDDIEEVSQYVAATEYGLQRLREDRPLTLRLLKEIHGILLSSGRGSEKTPGEFRRSQVWIGGTRPGNAVFVPPPPYEVNSCMGDLENFVHDYPPHGSGAEARPQRTPILIKAALAHVQFETIHPFLDGNGRLGRLLITLILCAEGAISEPLLYLSLYLKQHRPRYYELLQEVRLTGDWEAWLEFFLDGVTETSETAANTARRILALFDRDRKRIDGMGRQAGSALRVHQALCRRVAGSVSRLAGSTGLSAPTVTAALNGMANIGLVREVTGRTKDRVYVYIEYLAILNEGTELPAR